MGFHLQLFSPKFSDWVIVLLVLFLPAALTAYVLHNLAWLVVVPSGIIVLAFLAAALPVKRKTVHSQIPKLSESVCAWVERVIVNEYVRPDFDHPRTRFAQRQDAKS